MSASFSAYLGPGNTLYRSTQIPWIWSVLSGDESFSPRLLRRVVWILGRRRMNEVIFISSWLFLRTASAIGWGYHEIKEFQGKKGTHKTFVETDWCTNQTRKVVIQVKNKISSDGWNRCIAFLSRILWGGAKSHSL